MHQHVAQHVSQRRAPDKRSHLRESVSDSEGNSLATDCITVAGGADGLCGFAPWREMAFCLDFTHAKWQRDAKAKRKVLAATAQSDSGHPYTPIHRFNPKDEN